MHRITTRIVFLALGLAAVAGEARACSQCLCGSPTPPGFLLNTTSGQFSYGFEERFLNKANGLEGGAPGEERQIENRIAALGFYHPRPNLAFQARLPYVFKNNTAAPAGEAETLTRTNGIGDLDVLARWNAWSRGDMMSSRRSVLGLVAAASAPTGAHEEKDANGDLLDAHLQPGTGAWSGQAGLAFDYLASATAWTASVMGRANSTNTHGFQYGSAILFNAGIARTLTSMWQASLELNGRSAAKDHASADEQDPNSGGTVMYATPGLIWSGFAPLAIDLLVQIPIVQSLNGDQTEKTTARLALLWSGH
jgi:hypothetical protein